MGSKGGKSQTVQNTYPPEILNAITSNVNYANDISSKPFAGYYDYSKGFNADNYMSQNADVSKGYQDYLNGFQANAGKFDPSAYLKANSDVQTTASQMSGAGSQFATPEAYAQWHYDHYGKSEGRAGGITDASAPMSAADYALNHWNTVGQTQGRTGGYDTKQLVAGFNPDQQTAFNMARTQAGQAAPDMGYGLAQQAGTNAQTRDFGYGAAQDLTSFNPQQVTAGSLNGADLSGYTNPWENTVVGNAMRDIATQGDQSANAIRARSAAAGGFGGSRSALLEAENTKNYAKTAADTAASLRQSGYTNAQNVATADLNRALQAGMANQSADLAGANVRLGAAGQMAQSGTAQNNALLGAATGMQNAAGASQAYGTNNINTMLTIGGQQQQNSQAQLDSQYEQYLRSIGYPIDMLKVRQIPLNGALPSMQTSSGGGGSSAAQTIGSLGSAASGAAALISVLSDRRAKTDIRRVGTLDNGLPVYAYRYKDGGPTQIGVMAQDVEQVRPEAVSETAEGVKMVNYDLATEAA